MLRPGSGHRMKTTRKSSATEYVIIAGTSCSVLEKVYDGGTNSTSQAKVFQ